eukprot:gene9005-9178_t
MPKTCLVQAHEGWILQIEDTYLWYGSSNKHSSTTSAGDEVWVSNSVALYVSHDLASWHKKATVFNTAAVPAASKQRLLAQGGNEAIRIERPKVLYNSARRYYVLIFHLDNLDGTLSQVGFATSVSPYGPFTFEGSVQPDGQPSSDITVAATEAGDAYLETGAAAAAEVAPVFRAEGAAANARSGAAAPALFTFRGRWYLLLAQHNPRKSRWLSGPSELYVSDGPSLCGAEWQMLKRPTSGSGSETTYDSQPAFVFSFSFPSTSQELLIYYGDRWNVEGPGSVGNATYVWLPLVPDATVDLGLQLLDPGQSWRLGDYKTQQPTVAR